jgi:hypothetical protein
VLPTSFLRIPKTHNRTSLQVWHANVVHFCSFCKQTFSGATRKWDALYKEEEEFCFPSDNRNAIAQLVAIYCHEWLLSVGKLFESLVHHSVSDPIYSAQQDIHTSEERDSVGTLYSFTCDERSRYIETPSVDISHEMKWLPHPFQSSRLEIPMLFASLKQSGLR